MHHSTDQRSFSKMEGSKLLAVIAVVCTQVHGFPYGNLSPEFIWDTYRCTNIQPIVDSKTIILIAKGKFPEDKFCHSIRRDLKVSDGLAYTMSAEFLIVSGRRSQGKPLANSGFAFNYWDDNNYDFVFLQ